jgi:hypothetical protein
MKTTDITFDQVRGYLLQRPSGEFLRALNVETFIQWRSEVVPICSEVEVIKEGKLSPFKVLIHPLRGTIS